MKANVKRNIYCKELEKIIYVEDEEMDHYKVKSEEDPENQERQVWAIAVSPDGSHLATGDLMGYIRIYDMETSDELKQTLAHE